MVFVLQKSPMSDDYHIINETFYICFLFIFIFYLLSCSSTKTHDTTNLLSPCAVQVDKVTTNCISHCTIWCNYLKIFMVVKITFLGTIIFQLNKHRDISHIMAIYKHMRIRKIRSIVPSKKIDPAVASLPS